MDIPGVVGYEIVSMNAGGSPTGSPPSFVSANVNMASVQVDDEYTVPVTFIVTSLLAGNEICHASYTSESSLF